jgi:hypothetical protein
MSGTKCHLVLDILSVTLRKLFSGLIQWAIPDLPHERDQKLTYLPFLGIPNPLWA